MEIYNIHSDFKRQPKVRRKLLPDILLNLRRYPDQVVRLIFARPTDFLRRWDDLNRTRHITGIAANDCHQNTGVRVVYTSAHTLRLEDTSPKTLAEFKLNWLTRSLLRCGFGPLSPNQRLLHVQLDPYARMSRFVNTHVLAHELSQAAILDALRAGRVFIGFDLIADSATFRWLAENQNGRAMMGETLGFSPFTTLRALSPLPCRFTVLRDGQTAHQRQGRTLEWTAPAPGKYRVEAELEVRGQWVPWVYANPIELR
jgi:hypothetical protein